MRIVFMGTPAFSVSVLKALFGAGHEIVAVYSQPPRRAGRGKKPRPSAVQEFAESVGLPVFTPLNFKDDSEIESFWSHKADIAIVVAYGLILPQKLLDIPPLGCLNIHASLLPRWRGAAPIQRAIMAGDTETGVCIMQMEAGLDTGPVIACKPTQIQLHDTADLLHDKLAKLGSELIVDVLRKERFTAKPQSDTGITYAEKISKSEARIDWSKPANLVDQQIRGLSPFPGAWCEMNGERVKVLGSAVIEQGGEPGEVLDDMFAVACGEGAIRCTKLQRAGKGPMDAKVFKLGFPINKGTIID